MAKINYEIPRNPRLDAEHREKVEAELSEKAQTKPAPKKKSKATERSPEVQEIWKRFYDRFKDLHGYAYPGDYMQDTAKLKKLLTATGINASFVMQMIDVIFDEWGGIYKKQIATVATLCYDDSKIKLVDIVNKKNQVGQTKEINFEDVFGTIIPRRENH